MKKIFSFLKRNYKPILTSFLLSLLLWVVVTTDKTYTTRIEVPLKILSLAKNKILVEQPPETVLLEVTGKGRGLIGLNFFSTSFDLELSDIKSTTSFNLMDYSSQFNIPRDLNIKIVDVIAPKSIRLVVDDYVEVRKPVKLISQIKPSPGYILMDITLAQDSVILSGPASIVDHVDYLSNKPFYQADIKYPFTERIPLVEPKPGVTKLMPPSIDVTFQVEQLVERNLYNIPIQMVGVPDNLEANAIPPNISIRVKGGESIVSGLWPEQITAVFNYTRDYRKGKVRYPLQVDVPQDISVAGISPSSFRLQLKKRDSSE